MSFNLQTQSGYSLDEVISALQKDIRRGNEDQALYWCLELVPRYEAYLWRRLIVICNEDIGLGAPELLIQIPALREQFFEFREEGKDGTCRLILANAMLLMARAPKARIADHMQRVVTQQWMNDQQSGVRREVPDYALDKHTRRGRHLGRDFSHWVDEGCKLANPAPVNDPYAELAQSLWRADKNDAPTWGKRRRGETEQLNMFE